MRHLHRVLLSFSLALSCGGGTDIGAPCDKDEQCGGDLICDVHDGKGTCQTAHEHVSGGAGTAGSSTATETVDEVCTDYCACLDAHCAKVGQFPYADTAACEAACAGFAAEERTCLAAYCVFAAMEDPALAHYCEHASGSLGLAECG